MFIFYTSLIINLNNRANVLHSWPITECCTQLEFVGKLLFLDKSIGGYTGISPTRFLIRQYPDPITESLSFWRPLLNCGNKYTSIEKIAMQAWNLIKKRKRSGWIR